METEATLWEKYLKIKQTFGNRTVSRIIFKSAFTTE